MQHKCPKCGNTQKMLSCKDDEWFYICMTITGEGCGKTFPLDEKGKKFASEVEAATFIDPEEYLRQQAKTEYQQKLVVSEEYSQYVH